MRIAIDYDGTLVRQDRAYDDLDGYPALQHGAREALTALKAAGHRLLLYSARANLALRENPYLDPLLPNRGRSSVSRRWRRNQELNRARYELMVRHVEEELPGLFDAIDDGRQGKPSADLFIDDRAIRFGYGADALDWIELGEMYGDLPDEELEEPARPIGERETLPAPGAPSEAFSEMDAAVYALALARTSEAPGDALAKLQDAHAAVFRAIQAVRGDQP